MLKVFELILLTTSGNAGAPRGRRKLSFKRGQDLRIGKLQEEDGEWYASCVDSGWHEEWFPLSSTDGGCVALKFPDSYYELSLVDPEEMTMPELRAALVECGLNGKTLGLGNKTAKEELVERLQGVWKERAADRLRAVNALRASIEKAAAARLQAVNALRAPIEKAEVERREVLEMLQEYDTQKAAKAQAEIYWKATLSEGHNGAVTQVQFTPDGATLVSQSKPPKPPRKRGGEPPFQQDFGASAASAASAGQSADSTLFWDVVTGMRKDKVAIEQFAFPNAGIKLPQGWRVGPFLVTKTDDLLLVADVDGGANDGAAASKKKLAAFFRAPSAISRISCAGDKIAVACDNFAVLMLHAEWLSGGDAAHSSLVTVCEAEEEMREA